MIRWILGLLGLVFLRWPGAILGFIIGSIIDNMYAGKTYPHRNRGFGNSGDRVTPADFELNLLSLASLVIKADGTVSQTELDFVRQYFIQAYGKDRANAIFKTFNEVIKKQGIMADKIGQMFRQQMRYESRLQVIHFLFSIANADGHVTQAEVQEIAKIAGHMGIQMRDFESIKAMFFNNPDSAYKILEIEKDASVAEIKKAYRDMVKKYHPDKLQHMDEVYQKGAEEKFRKVREAYEQLQKEKGF
jgi:DnaJ like chaperone protein